VFPHDDVDSDYIFYSLPQELKKIEARTSFATVKHLSAKELNKIQISVPSISEQRIIAKKITVVSNIITKRKRELEQFDLLIKARFVEMFGDPITNNKGLPTEKMDNRYFLKAGITTSADDIHEYTEGNYEVPCYGGNGIRGYVGEFSYEGDYPIIGRQGALCGNVQYASGKFHATEHAVLVSALKDDNTIWVYYMLKFMNLYRYHTGAAQPGLAVKTLNIVDVIVAEKKLQNQFADFVTQVDKSKLLLIRDP
jgi:type I restriction enzyme S subunit